MRGKSETFVPMAYWNLNGSQYPLNKSWFVSFLLYFSLNIFRFLKVTWQLLPCVIKQKSQGKSVPLCVFNDVCLKMNQRALMSRENLKNGGYRNG